MSYRVNIDFILGKDKGITTKAVLFNVFLIIIPFFIFRSIIDHMVDQIFAIFDRYFIIKKRSYSI